MEISRNTFQVFESTNCNGKKITGLNTKEDQRKLHGSRSSFKINFTSPPCHPISPFFLHSEMYPFFSLLSSISFLFFLFNLPMPTFCRNEYNSCNHHNFSCGGTIQQIYYPFWSDAQAEYCGHPNFKLECQDDTPGIHITSQNYNVFNINQDNQTLKIARADSWNGSCPTQLNIPTPDFNYTIFDISGTDTQNLTLYYGCPSSLSKYINHFSCECQSTTILAVNSSTCLFSTRSKPLENMYEKEAKEACGFVIVVPIAGTDFTNLSENELKEILKKEFEVKYTVDLETCNRCDQSSGECGYNKETLQSTCFKPKGGDSGKIIGIVTGTVLGVVLLACILFFVYRRRKKLQSKSSALISRSVTPDSSLKPDLEKGSSYFQTPIFTYNELQEATNNFDSSKEIGDGGFGTVYYGKLKDGRVVAVKRLYENNYKRVEQFMNEITILSRLRHQNLVTLYGCTSRHSRELLLVYEYVPNGTVADHLHGERAATSPLPWPVRMSIAIETADAIAYLHASDTIHRDVKTNNILLDNNFQVKVADFGLSRLFPTDVTHVSTAPQGTPGYVDPEYYQCYQLNDKSDVYSFGVVLIEIISSKPAVDIGRHRHEINLSNMAINKIQNDALHELVDPSLGFETDYTLRRMVTMVAELAFRCLQQEKDMRPSMSEVLQSLREIKSEEFKGEKEDEVDNRADARLLKNIPPFSPTSVTDKWVSNATTPNTSG